MTTPPTIKRATPPPARRPVPSWAAWSLRILVLLVAVLVLGQAILAGLFVTGDVAMLEQHSTHATFILAAVFFQFIAAIFVWKPGGGPSWPIWASLAVFVLAELQAGFGYGRVIVPHIVGGTLLFGIAVAMLVLTWSPRLRRPR